MTRHLIADGHLDLAMNAVKENRDQLKPVSSLRAREHERYLTRAGSRRTAPKGRCVNTVSLPAMRSGNVFLALGTVLARTEHRTNDYTGYDGQDICYAAARGQLAYYELLEARDELRMIRTAADLEAHVDAWRTADQTPPVGIVLAMEGADPILDPTHTDEWWEYGLRAVGLSHYGKSAYANGTGCEGGLTPEGFELLDAMERHGMLLDLTHLADDAFWEAIEAFDGPVHASHCNCRSLVPGQRQLTDDQLQAIIDRDGVIGVALDAWMVQPGWEKGVYNEITVTLDDVVDHVDHICELAGGVDHVAIGSDLDGGFGLEQVPRGLDTIADLATFATLLDERGYDEQEVSQFMHGNWVRLLERSLP